MRVRGSMFIEREPDEIFACVSDPSNDPSWRSFLVASRAVGALAVGSIVRQTYSYQGHRMGISTTCQRSPAVALLTCSSACVRRSSSGKSSSMCLPSTSSAVRKVSCSKAGLKRVMRSSGTVLPAQRPKSGLEHTRKARNLVSSEPLCALVAGAGFEPTTFGL